jgi:hypothetical protein
LDSPITEEVKKVIFEVQPEKASDPDGFTGLFYKTCWQIVKHDLMQAIHQLYNLRASHWNLLNPANVILILKKGVITAADYRLISLMHSMAKIMGKLLANRLSPHLNNLVVFIKGRSILDNFQYVQGAVNHFYRSKTPMPFLKLDVTKAFDSIRWDYMLEIL